MIVVYRFLFPNLKTYVGTWTNLNKCGQDLGLYRGNISHCLSGKLKTTGGYSFERI
jgi:hypothetical protein